MDILISFNKMNKVIFFLKQINGPVINIIASCLASMNYDVINIEDTLQNVKEIFWGWGQSENLNISSGTPS